MGFKHAAAFAGTAILLTLVVSMAQTLSELETPIDKVFAEERIYISECDKNGNNGYLKRYAYTVRSVCSNNGTHPVGPQSYILDGATTRLDIVLGAPASGSDPRTWGRSQDHSVDDPDAGVSEEVMQERSGCLEMVSAPRCRVIISPGNLL